MSKELFVSSTPHETKVAIVEDDQLTEIYFERENEYTLAGSIYKGRVTRVLPGMQSAFVDIGLERDAFLYVTDFLEEQEDQEEFDRVITQAHDEAYKPRGEAREERAPREDRGPREGRGREERRREPRLDRLASAPMLEAPAPSLPAETQEEAQPASEPPQREAGAPGQRDRNGDRGGDRDGRGGWRNRRRRGRGRGRGFPDSKFAAPRAEEERPVQATTYGPPAGYTPIILPGESISKYRNAPPPQSAPAATEEREAPTRPVPPAFDPHVEEEAQAIAARWTAPAEEREPEPAEPPKRDTEEIDVPAVLQQHEQERQPQREQERHVISASAAVEPEERVSETSPVMEAGPGPVPFTPGAGVIEEETIEEEEGELPAMQGASEEHDFEDLEEETLQPADEEAPFGGVMPPVSEVVQTAATEAAAEAEEYGEEEDEGEEEEFEEDEAEVLAEGDETGGESARAELRGPNGTAGYQQRAERPQRGGDRGRDRGGRGRRGGRRMPSRRSAQRGGGPAISDLLKEGQEILVQIAKEPIAKKGARITSHVALPGRFLVFMPTVNHIGVSRKIASDEERQRLKRVIQDEHGGPGGFIVRTAAAGASDDDLRADVRFLINLWTEIRNRAEDSKAPALIYHDLNLVERILRDQVTQNFSQIWVDTEPEYERILRFASRFQPSLVKRIKLYTKDAPLFEQFNIQEELNKALKSKVWLKSGGYIVINQTEALVAIDINTGKYVGKTGRLEDTIVKTNVDAIKEIVRQIRLRDLGGIIVIDFIDMDERKNRHKVMQALEEELKHDRSPSKVLQFNDFGLVAITRKRVKQSLERTLGQPCTYCTGTGLIKSVTTVCNEIYLEMRKISKHLERGDVMLRVNPEVGKALKANNARWITELEELTGRSVIVKGDPMLHQEQFDIN